MPSEEILEQEMEPYVCSLSEEVKRYAAEKLHEDEDHREEETKKIRQWLQEEKHLGARIDDLSILKFLRGCKFNIEITKRKLKNFYEMRAKVPEWYNNRDPSLPELQDLLKMGVFIPLMEKGPDGEQVVIIRAAVHDPRKQKQDNVFKMSNMIVDMILNDDELISVYGVIAVVDLKGVSLGHALQLTPSIIRKAVHSWQDCYPVRVRSMNFINGPPYVDVVLNIFRRFMNQKMASRVFVHGKNIDSFHKIVPASILPDEYGGTKGKLDELIVHWKKLVMEKRNWFLEDEKYVAQL